jgi:cold shock protein
MWNIDWGYGFMANDAGGPDMFMHFTALQSARFDPDTLGTGERPTFDVENTREGKTKASNVRRPCWKAKIMINLTAAECRDKAEQAEALGVLKAKGKWTS